MTAAAAGELKRPPLTIEVTIDDGTTKEIKLSYGLFNDLQRTLPDPGAVLDTMIADPYTRDYIIRRCMTPTKKIVKDPETELVAAEDTGLDDPDEIDKLLQWVTEHMLYFFAISAGGMKRLSEAFKVKLGPLPDQPAPSTSGSPS